MPRMNDHGDQRPLPEALLERAKKEGRGRLKIFLGAAPGVGKTYEMLSQARQRRLDGADVVIGVVETHGRSETDALTKGLEAIRKKRQLYKGHLLAEMDLDAVIQRRPQLVLVDELAHTNTEASRHPKRYLDVEELLNAGIDVYTTVNVQHIESLNDIVAQITRIRVRETVPDRIIDEADEIEVVDTTAEDLIKRLETGKVYVKATAERALRHYFLPGNLAALRELALRKAAQRVDREMVEYMQSHAITGPWAASERVLVCINEHATSAELVRHAKRMANDMKAPWTAAYIETPRYAALSENERDRVADALRLAQQLGGETVTLPGSNIAAAILAYGQKNNVTQIVIGKTERPFWFEYVHGSVVAELIRKSGAIAVNVVSPRAGTASVRTVKLAPRPSSEPWQPYAWSALAVVGAVAVAKLLDTAIGFGSLSMILLLPVLFSAVSFGLRPALVASVLSVLAYNFFFLPPLYTFTIADPDNVLSLGVLLIVAVIASNLTARVRVQADLASARAMIASELYSFAGKLAGIARLEDILWASCFQIATMLKTNVVILLPDAETKRPVIRAGHPPEDELDGQDMAAAAWCWDHGRPAGHGSDTLPGAPRLFLPMRTGQGLVGVVGLQRHEARSLLAPDERRLLDALMDQIALAVERSNLVEQIEEARVHEQADRLRVAMLASLSHDLRTPLASILGAATSLRGFPATYDAAQREELLATVQQEAERLDRFVANLLHMSRLEAEVAGAKLEATDIPEIVEAAQKRLARVLARHRIARDSSDGLALADADPLLLEQSLVNLLDNAAKFAPEGSTIRISVSDSDGRVTVRVEDEGPGIPAEDLPHIFDKFYRAKAGDQKVAGTGLGLAVAKGFVEAMGGTLTASNRAGVRGAIFSISLSAVERPAVPHVA